MVIKRGTLSIEDGVWPKKKIWIVYHLDLIRYVERESVTPLLPSSSSNLCVLPHCQPHTGGLLDGHLSN